MSHAKTTLTLRLPAEVAERLEELARAMDRSGTRLAEDAIRSYLDVQEWQIRQIHEGIREADAGELASDEEVAAVFSKWLDAR